ncbi:MAG TPA: methyltransferase domain-containing protein [Polyangiaceae bacterium]|jgi:ubiquinone/menaquinone biosynthesis C-methylase UbiE|nr:methyltransferase domain-containing protein [Polyangiaceae bacterium]
MRVQLGKPTSYGYTLPVIRHGLARARYPRLGARNKLLDFGSGNGANTVLFAPDFDHVLGVDVEPERVSEARANAEQKGLTNLEYSLYDGEHLPLADQSIDCVVSFEVIEHTHDDRAALREISRVLKPGGLFCGSVPNKFYLMETHGFDLPFADVIPYSRVPLMNLLPRSFYRRFGNAAIYTRRQFSSLLEDAGFSNIDTEYIRPPFDKVENARLQQALRAAYARLPAFMGVSIFFAAQAGSSRAS